MKEKKSWLFPSILGIFLFLICLYLTEIPNTDIIYEVDKKWLLLAILAQGGFALPMPWRWKIVSAGANVNIPYLPAFKITAYTSLAAAVIPQSLADLAGRGPWEARYTNCGLLNATNIILCDRLLDVYIIGLLFPAAFLFVFKRPDDMFMISVGIISLLLGGILLLALRERFFLLFEILFKIIHGFCDRFSFLKGKFNWHVSPISLPVNKLLLVYGLSVFKFFVMAFATYAYFKVVNLQVPFIFVFFALPVTQFIFIFAFTPGGLGIFELGWVALMKMHQIIGQDIALFIISQRICFTLGVAFWALCAFALWKVSLFPAKVVNANESGRN